MRRTLTTLAAGSLGALLLASAAPATTLPPAAAQLAAPAPAFGPRPFLLADIDPLPDIISDPGAGIKVPIDKSAVVGSRVVFATGPQGGRVEPWVSDGTPAGTHQLKDIYPGTATGSDAHSFVAFKGKVYFAATDPTQGEELWATDGTPAGTRRITSIRPGAQPSTLSQLTVAKGRLYFTADTADLGYELWTTDGTTTPTATHVVRDIETGPGDSNPLYLTPYDGGLAFTALDSNGDSRPFATDGTAAGTHLLDGGADGPALNATEMVSTGPTVLFRAGASGDSELWGSTGEPLSAALIKDINPGSTASSRPGSFVLVGHTVYFAAQTADEGTELWSTDGTRGGTQLLRDIRDDAGSATPRNLVAYGDALYFTANDGTHGRELWVSRGLSSNTRMVRDINTADFASSNPTAIWRVGDLLAFSADDSLHGRELWTTDGTSTGTRLAFDLAPGSESTSPVVFAHLGATVLFKALVGGRLQLWAYTTRISTTRAYPKKTYTRSNATKKRIRVTVKVTAPGATPTGTITLRRGSKTIGRAQLHAGTAYVRITTRLRKGTHTIKASYPGSIHAQTSTTTFKVRIR